MNNKKDKVIIKKLNEDDILEILIEHFWEGELKDKVTAKGLILGVPGKNLRFIGAFGNEECDEIYNYDLEEIDKNHEFNGSHSFLEKNPDFYINPEEIF